MNLIQKINKRYTLIPKLMQLIINLQYYTLHQIRFLFATKKFNISIGEYGEYNAYVVCLTFFTNLFVGSYSDKRGNHKFLLMGFIVITVFTLLLFYIPYLSKSEIAFWGILIVYQTFNMPKQPLMDKLIVEYLKENTLGGVQAYGRQRTFGTVAYAIATFTIEALVKKFEKNKEVYRWNNLILYSITFAVFSLILLSVVKSSPTTIYRGKTEGYLKLLQNKEFSFFLLIMFMNAVTRNAMSAYLSNFYTHILKIKPYKIPKGVPLLLGKVLDFFNKNYIGTITLCGTILEILTMHVSSSIIKRFGLFLPLFVAQLFSLARFIAYYMVPAKFSYGYPYTCCVELLKGIYFGLAHTTGFAIATKLTPPGLLATSQMMFQGTFLALGALTSGLLFGRLFDTVLKNKDATLPELEGAFKNLFKINIYFSIAIIIIFFIKYQLYDGVIFNKEKENEKLKEFDISVANDNIEVK